ncbi:hypothetical protein [Methanoregula formicica]|uniref:Uncharacterized protein n=1 Tax=Methanoregula formicica (strain DSM 22288 / NBRC 105244 / SMSP) TaxID=593750 RepID=L0HD09_METFS|nr:hypothetical protein [Methanoregula formicica]AGB02617.1 hypothetical protein Metfor_1587 [Methanoregula formicica SMSP]
MLDAFLNPSAIAFITSLGAPAGLFAAEATGTFAQSLVISGATNALTGFFQKRLTAEKLRNIYTNAVKKTLADETLTIEQQIREQLFTSTLFFDDFSRFIGKFNQLHELAFNKRKEEASAAFREYVR